VIRLIKYFLKRVLKNS